MFGVRADCGGRCVYMCTHIDILHTNVTYLLYGAGAPPKTLTMMVTWTLYVREDSVNPTLAAKMQELGMDVAVKVHVVEGVEKHWKVESVKRESRGVLSSVGRAESAHAPVSDPFAALVGVRSPVGENDRSTGARPAAPRRNAGRVTGRPNYQMVYTRISLR